MRRTKVEHLSTMTLTPVTTSKYHHILHKIGRKILTRGRAVRAPKSLLYSFQRAADVQNPELVQHLQFISPTKYSNIVLI
jgi:hypothetical protein